MLLTAGEEEDTERDDGCRLNDCELRWDETRPLSKERGWLDGRLCETEGPEERLPEGADMDRPDGREDMPDEREDILDCEEPLDELDWDPLDIAPELPPERPPDPERPPPPPLPKTDIGRKKQIASVMITKTRCLNPFFPIAIPLTTAIIIRSVL